MILRVVKAQNKPYFAFKRVRQIIFVISAIYTLNPTRLKLKEKCLKRKKTFLPLRAFLICSVGITIFIYMHLKLTLDNTKLD